MHQAFFIFFLPCMPPWKYFMLCIFVQLPSNHTLRIGHTTICWPTLPTRPGPACVLSFDIFFLPMKTLFQFSFFKFANKFLPNFSGSIFSMRVKVSTQWGIFNLCFWTWMLKNTYIIMCSDMICPSKNSFKVLLQRVF